MRISDWSSDACSSDLGRCGRAVRFQAGAQAPPRLGQTQDQTRPETARRSRTKMRIIAGQWRGRPPVAPKGDATRPTADRTREALLSLHARRLGTSEAPATAPLFAGPGRPGSHTLTR